jgi:formate dehydrogenase subunit beta
MKVDRIVEVGHEGPLAAMQGLLRGFWESNQLTAMLAPVELDDGREVSPQAVTSIEAIGSVNPFSPTMSANAAALVVGFAREHPSGPLAAVLRPCEWRALVEMRKRHRTTPEADQLMVITVDCLGTFPSGSWANRARECSPADLWRQALNFADEGGFTPDCLRRGCQFCAEASAHDTDVTIGLFGLDTSQGLLATCADEATDGRLHLEAIAPRRAPEAMVVQREVAIGALAERRARRREALLEGARRHDGGLAGILGIFANCSQCGDCLDACPLYNGELSGMLGVRSARHGGRSLLGELVELARWLASCSECGMCEEVCSCGVPLLDLVAPLSRRVREEIAYHPGDPRQPLPWLAG